jgi:glycosyltransferase involved in cell wall biosynthesis
VTAAGPRAVVVCPVLPWPPAGGAEKRTLRLLEAMERAGAVPHLLTLDSSPDAADALRGRGWTVEVVRDPRPSPVQRSAQHLRRRPSPYVRDLAASLAGLRPADAAFVQLEHTMSAYYFRHLPSRPVALSTQNVDSQMLATIARNERPLTPGWARAWNRALAMRTVERRAAPRANVVLSVSDHDAAHFAGLGAHTLLVPNGVDDELFAVPEESPGGETVLFFGRLDYPPNDHGLRRFLAESWPRIAQERPAARLRVVGGGLGEAAAAAVSGAERVEATGIVEDIVAELGASDLVVVPIWHGGGTRLKALEALAAARPIAGTPLGLSGIGVQADVHALVAEEPDALGAAAAALLGDPARARRLAVAGRALADGYRWTATTAPAVELYAGWVAKAASTKSAVKL